MGEYIGLAGSRERSMGVSLPDPVVADIRHEWHWVKPGIEEILNADSSLTFLPEDVYAYCKSEAALLWVTDDGFAVTTTETDEFTGDKTFLVWLAWAKSRGANLAVLHYEFFAKRAKEVGFAHIEVRSSVPALQKYLPENGWRVATVVYTRDL